MANRTRRIVIDGNQFLNSGIEWNADFRATFTDDGANQDFLQGNNFAYNSQPDYTRVALPFTVNLGAGVSTNVVLVWGANFASFGELTSAQRHFMTAFNEATLLTDFPGSYVAHSFGTNAFEYDINVGRRDFTPEVDPFNLNGTPIYNIADAIDVLYVGWDSRRILVTPNSIQYSPQFNLGNSDFDKIAIAGTVAPPPVVTGDGLANRLVAGSSPSFDYDAPAILKLNTVSNPLSNPISLDRQFDFRSNPDIADSETIPHATVHAQWSGAREAYSFTVPVGGANATFDIDAAVGIDTVIRLYNGDGTPVINPNTGAQVQNDDPAISAGGPFDSGSGSIRDSLLTYSFAQGGVYIIEVGRFGDFLNNTPSPYTLHVSLERARITTLFGNEGAQLSGFDGNDTLISGSGSDRLDGGNGIDFASFENAPGPVTASLTANRASGDGDDVFVAIENVAGSAFGDVLIGNLLANTLSGNGGDDIIDGGDGVNVLSGGPGNDRLTGGVDKDTIVGGDGDDVIMPGAGNNELIGGNGDDIYQLINAGDSIIESNGEAGGIDEVRMAFATYTAPNSVETIRYTGTSAFIGQGNEGANRVFGGAAADQLFGRGGNDLLSGGAGAANTLVGGAGDDVYLVDVAGDSTIEAANEGTDEVRTTLAIHALQANVENLSFTEPTRNLGVGNALGNVITGNTGVDDLFGREGNDRLIGGAGAANTMLGQQGDDVYVVAAIGDTIIEFANEGTDTVETALASFVLRDHLENLTYTGTAAFTGIGASGANRITGGSGADFLSGLDGADILIGKSGADLLIGGTGADQFRYDGGETGFDRIFDFVSGTDKIALRDAGFAQTATVVLVQGAAPVATTTNSTFLYRSDTGMLSFDVDGTGATPAIALAQLNPGLTLAIGDFLFV